MRKFNIIKKSKRKSKDIDEKIEYLDKECQKTGLQEFMTTSNIYQGSTKVPNQEYSAFQALDANGYGLALSGADGNSIGGASVEDHLGANGVALSPPHPVTGVRTQALHVRDGLGGTTPLRPGAVIKRGFADNAPDYTMGSAMWFYFPTHNNGEGVPPGKWCNFEYGNFENNSGWGFWDTIKTGQFAGLHVFNRTTSQHPCGDINLATKIASINFGENGTVGAPQTTVLTQKDLGDPGHLPINLKDFSKQAFDWLLDKANKALGFEGDNLATKIEKTKDAFINFIGMTNPIAKLLSSIPVFDYASEILTSLILNEPIYKGNDDVSMEDKQNYIKGIAPGYFLDGPNSIPKSNNEKPYSDGNIYKDPNTNQVVAHTEESKKQFPDNTSTFSQTNLGALPIKGGDGTSFGNTVNLDPFMITNKISARGNMQTQIVEPEDGSEVYLKVHDFAYLNEDKINDSGELPSWLQQGIAKPLINLIDKFHGRKSGAENTGAMSGFSSNIHGASELEFVIPFSQWTKEQQDAYNKSKNKSVSESLNEAVKLGHFDPQVLNVDINNIRKGIMPEFPKDPPPEMINGYSAKSKLAPKKVELPPFIKVTKKDLAQNHKLTDKEIQDFLDDVNKINEYIKNNPADLKYAMIRYPKHDPRLAQLNWQMDQMKAASEEYMETHFPENEKLFKKIQNKIRDNIEKSDPRRIDTSVPIVSEEDARIAKERRLSVLERYKKQVDVKPFFNKKTPEIDWKIDYLNKELVKNGIDEANTTSGIYVGTQRNPNSGYAEITGKNFNGRGLAMSGDSNLGQGNFGGASIRASDGAALSPPHPVTGERRVAYTKGSIGVGGSKIAIPGERRTPQHRMTGPIMWYWNSSYNFGGQQGRWQSLEYNAPGVHGNSPYPTYQAGWGYWGSGAFGLLLRNDGASYAGLFNTIDNFDPQDSIPDTTVLIKNDLDDPNFTPIDIAKKFIAGLLGLAGEGYDWLSDKVNDARAIGDGLKGILDAIPPFLNYLFHQVNDNSPWTPENPFPVDLDDNQTEGIKNDIEELFDKWGDKRVDELNDGDPMTTDEMNELNKTINANKTSKGSDALDAKYPSSRLTLNNIGNPNAFEGNVETKKDGSKTPTAIEDNYVFEGDSDASVPGAPSIIKFLLNQPNVQDAIEKSGLDYPYRKDQEATYDPLGAPTPTVSNKNMPIKVNLKTTSSVFEEKKSLNEGVKLGHFDPEVLNVDINDIRKGIMPEFPKDPPKMINGYSAKSRLAPKVVKGESFIKVTKKDLAALHILKDSEIKELLQQIDLINAYLKNNPADLVYAQERYPKHDIRLAKLNWQMDQQLQASEKYMDTHFPENQKLFSKLQDKIVRNINQTDPKNFTGHKEAPKFDQTAISEQERRKQVIIRHFNKKKS